MIRALTKYSSLWMAIRKPSRPLPHRRKTLADDPTAMTVFEIRLPMTGSNPAKK